jgi:hypothetical protein
MQSIRAALDDADLVVQTLHESQGDFVLWLAVSSDPVPVTIDDLSELLVGFEPLPLESGAPVIEEAPRPTLAFVAPQLPEGFRIP